MGLLSQLSMELSCSLLFIRGRRGKELSQDDTDLGSARGFKCKELRLGLCFARLVDVTDGRLINEQMGTGVARQLDASTVVPFDVPLHLLAVFQNHHNQRLALNLL